MANFFSKLFSRNAKANTAPIVSVPNPIEPIPKKVLVEDKKPSNISVATSKAILRDFKNKYGVIDAIIEECKKQGLSLDTQIAYVLATVEHETGGTFQPVFEANYLKGKAKAYLRKLKYYPYYGRGYVQITWETNYKKYSDKLGIDLVKNPDLALDPEISLFILVDGFKNGVFTGKKLSDYVNLNKTDFLGARRCINGIDKNRHIADLAKNWLQYLDNLKIKTA